MAAAAAKLTRAIAESIRALPTTDGPDSSNPLLFCEVSSVVGGAADSTGPSDEVVANELSPLRTEGNVGLTETSEVWVEMMELSTVACCVGGPVDDDVCSVSTT